MATDRRNLFSVFQVLDEIQTQDSDIEPDAFESDEETADPTRNEDAMMPENDAGDSDTATDVDDNGWSRSLDNYPAIPGFSGVPGLHFPDGTDPLTPLEMLNIIFDKNLLKLLKRETNLYATSEIERVGANAKPNSIYKQWKPVTINDIRGVFTILIHMSLVCKPRIADYWTTNPILAATPFASQIMSRDRFVSIMAFFHVNDNTTYIPRGQAGHQPLHKIQPVYNHLRAVFSSVYTPEKKLAIDEAICPWRGNLRFRVYMKDKPSKWGIKLYELCESSSGYVCDLEIYAGDPAISNRPTDVCMSLMTPYLGLGYFLYTDNYYTCPTLAENLKREGTMSVVTVRHNRVGMPKSLVAEQLVRGQVDYRQKDGLCAIRWVDRKNVNILTTVHDPMASLIVRTRTAEREKPLAVQDYTLNMSGVDRSDQMLS